MAKRNSKSARRLLRPVENPPKVTLKPVEDVTEKPVIPMEDPPTAKRRLQLVEDDTPIKKKSKQLLENTLVESSDEDTATEEEEQQVSGSSSQTAPVETSDSTKEKEDVWDIGETQPINETELEGENVSESESEQTSTQEKEDVYDIGQTQPINETDPECENVSESESEQALTKEKEEGCETQPINESEDVVTEVKKKYFQRIWSEEDEIVLLQGMIDFYHNEGKTVYDDMSSFFDTVKDKISFSVKNISQFTRKIRKLKDKYTAKRVNGVDEESLTNDHDRQCYKLAKVAWRSPTVDDVTKPEDEKFTNNSDWFENSFLVGALTSFGVEEDVVKQRWNMVPIESKKMLEEKLNLLRGNELQFILEKSTFMQKLVTMSLRQFR